MYQLVANAHGVKVTNGWTPESSHHAYLCDVGNKICQLFVNVTHILCREACQRRMTGTQICAIARAASRILSQILWENVNVTSVQMRTAF